MNKINEFYIPFPFSYVSLNCFLGTNLGTNLAIVEPLAGVQRFGEFVGDVGKHSRRAHTQINNHSAGDSGDD